MKFILTIELGNKAMLEFGQIADALIETGKRMHEEDSGTDVYPQTGFPVSDSNGNTVGKWEITKGETLLMQFKRDGVKLWCHVRDGRAYPFLNNLMGKKIADALQQEDSLNLDKFHSWPADAFEAIDAHRAGKQVKCAYCSMMFTPSDAAKGTNAYAPDSCAAHTAEEMREHWKRTEVVSVVVGVEGRTPSPSKTCEEASPLSGLRYIPCGKPAIRQVYHPRDNRTYAMCSACADHNVTNRRAEYLVNIQS